jgi:hypothetical protein
MDPVARPDAGPVHRRQILGNGLAVFRSYFFISPSVLYLPLCLPVQGGGRPSYVHMMSDVRVFTSLPLFSFREMKSLELVLTRVQERIIFPPKFTSLKLFKCFDD